MEMREQLLKLQRGNSTKSERVFGELLKELHIPFRTKVRIGKYEADFLLGSTVVEIDGHKQNNEKNKYLLESGYNVLHLQNSELNDKQNIKLWLSKLQI